MGLTNLFATGGLMSAAETAKVVKPVFRCALAHELTSKVEFLGTFSRLRH